MPRFTIRRKAKPAEKKPEPKPAPVEEKIDDEEMSLSTSDEEFVNEAMDQLSIQNEPQKQEKRVHFEPKRRPQFETPARTVRPEARNRKFLTQGPGAPVRRNPLYRETPTAIAQNAGLRGRGKPRIKFRSLYGRNGDAYDTRTKAGMLYHACFG